MLVNRRDNAAVVSDRARERRVARGARDSAGILARLRRVRQHRSAGAQVRPPDGEYAFLLHRHLDAASLRRAEVIARAWRVALHEALIVLGWVSEEDYVRALAQHLGLQVVDRRRPAAPRTLTAYPPWPKVMSATFDDREIVVIEARSFTPRALQSIAASSGASGRRFALATRRDVGRSAERQIAPWLIDRAINGLWRQDRALSARTPHRLWQLVLAAVLLGMALGGLVAAPDMAMPALAAILAVPFLCVVALRAAAVVQILLSPDASVERAEASPQRDEDLPIYSVLVPLLREAEVLPALVRSLSAIDYPAAKLQILLVLESNDRETRAAAAALDLPGNFEVIVVPDRGPRTKPKALNYALELVRGEFVVVYDAEDVPAPGQIRQAVAMFRSAEPSLACIQARLNIYNPRQSWLTRQFTLEYSALFDAILPALERLDLPFPLGGTSNHFRVELLRRVGGWDAYNVTEDADLGFRIARAGLRGATLASTTWEEAPARLDNWMRQRTRWLKGWLLTYLVHTREPGRLLRDLGWRRSAGLHVLIGGMLLSALFHPLCYALIAMEVATGGVFAEAHSALERWLWWIAVFNLAVGYASGIAVGAVAVVRRGRPGLAWHALLTPLYWLLISVAGHRALLQLMRSPYLWEKTQHGNAKADVRRSGPEPDLGST